jgi:hypothetical protein
MNRTPAGKSIVLAALALSLLVGSLPAAASRTYDNPESTSAIGNEGCPWDFWGFQQAFDSWEGYSPFDSTIGSVFTLPAYASDLTDTLLLTALHFPAGGPTVLDKAGGLLKEATAAFLNAANSGIGYPERRFSEPGNILATVNAALASGDPTTMTALAAHYATLNNLGCPLHF